eukprot:CAMPEP_0185903320 /NCGR_PEP_ID=MMETSP0196C-20130402/2524_1 /TAXON_ID=2932 /ORGANISM="Alexandrium fundyense, Strain CCMP1719" /LENGTH=128 /DNA_ID=CAMNT_0028622335 /DNA_START=48 /DNA_END=434 /DNA_ORIENTATION=-
MSASSGSSWSFSTVVATDCCQSSIALRFSGSFIISLAFSCNSFAFSGSFITSSKTPRSGTAALLAMPAPSLKEANLGISKNPETLKTTCRAQTIQELASNLRRIAAIAASNSRRAVAGIPEGPELLMA